ncbi:MAG: hypothetical protein IPK98_05660 [Chloracidobacterium sp.]|nr:hypothetical protein [Chloracidobacterium sp.]
MKKVVLTFGLIAGLIIAGLVWVTAILVDRGAIGFERLEIVGYSSMIIALSMVFLGSNHTATIMPRGGLGFGKVYRSAC